MEEKKIQEWLSDARKRLSCKYGANELSAILYQLVEHSTGLNRAMIHARPERELDEEETRLLEDALDDLESFRPVQYIIGMVGFSGTTLRVTPSVLIPRPETEELVNIVANDHFIKSREHLRILDIGTGSGCIAIALKKQMPDAVLNAIDVSQPALDLAKENAVLNTTDIRFLRADILRQEEWKEIGPQDVIISNPPYVPERDKTRMDQNVLGYEPVQALFVPNDDPLLFYRMIAVFAKSYLATPGILFFEIYEQSGKEIVDLLAGKGFLDTILIRDLRGKDRFVRSVKK